MRCSSMNMGPTWWIACGSVGQSCWRTGRRWSACCWMSPRQERRVTVHAVVLCHLLVLVTFSRWASIFAILSTDRSPGDGSGGDNALRHPAGLWMPPSCRPRHGQTGECLVVALTWLSPCFLNDFLLLLYLVHGKRSWVQRRRRPSWTTGRVSQRCLRSRCLCCCQRWSLAFRVDNEFESEQFGLKSFSFLVTVLRRYR